jgi:serine/threonine protein kinase
MTPEQFVRVEQIFDAACALAPAARANFLATQAAGDAEVAAAVLALLAEDARAVAGSEVLAGKLDAVRHAARAEAAQSRTPDGADAQPGMSIGPYKLLQRLGEGGFGEVFLAQQEQPVARQVALKILKPGMDTRQVVARFEQERQALALMDHPHIARVLDAGATASGRPFFAMDLVKGQPIVDYCDHHRLTIDERLELFSQVCGAIQHAHGKGIIHRDLKPSNVLVGAQDGKAQAKVIDFGIAKAVASRLTDKTVFTEQHQVVGTLQYMSPEQAEGSLDIDTRTDVYSLGILLYELLAGSTPFESRSYGELHRMVREVDPPRPSTRISSTQTRAEIAARRRVEPAQLGAMIRELDWIAMKAIEKDRARRYESASALALDVARYRRGDPVTAVPPSASYRVRKFVRKNRALVAAGAAVFASLVAGVVAFAWQASVTRGQRDRALAAEDESSKRARELERVAEFQARMLAQVDPASAGRLLREDLRAAHDAGLLRAGLPDAERAERQRAFATELDALNATDAATALIDKTILRPAVASIDQQFAEQPLVAAQLRQTLALLYRQFHLFDAATPLQAFALETRTHLRGPDHQETLDSLNEAGQLLLKKGDLTAAETQFRDVLARCRRVLGEDHVTTLLALTNLGFTLRNLGRLDEAATVTADTLQRQRRVLGDDHADTMTSHDNLGMVLHAQGKFADAEQCHREVLAKRRRVRGEQHEETLISLSNLGYALLAQAKWTDAETVIRECVDKQRAVHGTAHLDTVAAINNLGYTLQYQGKRNEAEPYVREAMASYARIAGAEHPDTLTARNNLGLLLQEQGRMLEAEDMLRAVLESRTRVLGAEHPDTLSSIGNLGRLLQAIGRLDDAEPFLRDALDKKRRVRGDDHPDTLTSINGLGSLQQSRGQLVEAEALYREAMDKCRRVLGPEHMNTFITTTNTGAALVALGRHAEAVELLAPVVDAARRQFQGSQAGWLSKLLANLGRARVALAQFAAAETCLREAHAVAETTYGPTSRSTRDCMRALGELYAAWHQAAPNGGHDAQAAQWRERIQKLDASAAK